MTDTIGQRLKRERKHRHLTLEKAAEATRIRQGYLQALEADDYSAMPSPVHARGFLRNYAQYLELDLDQMVQELRENQLEQKPGVEPEVFLEREEAALPLPPEGFLPKVETADTHVETPAEPFWQTWLRRTKSEIGEPEEKDGFSLQKEPPSEKGSPTETILSHSPGVLVGDNGANERQGSDIAERNIATRPVSVSDGTQAAESKVEKRPSLWAQFRDRIKFPRPRKQAIPVPVAEITDNPEPEPEVKPEPEPPAGPTTPSQEIINEIAQQLRRRREMLSLTLDEIERHTRLRVEIMDALEKGNFDELPSPVQTRGMLANYASFLDLEVDALLLRFADALQARHRERHPEKPARRRGQPIVPKNLPPFRTFIAGDVIFGIGMVLLLVGFSAWGISRVISLQSEQRTGAQAEATGPSISEALIGTPVETFKAEITLIPAEDTPISGPVEAEPTIEVPTLATTANVQVNIVASERSFLRVLVDGELAFEGRTIPGNAYPFEAEQSIEILAGNGAALRVIYNQRDLGLLGGFGQISSFIYTADEILVPTPAMSPTVTSTPFISPTPSITPSPTLTPAPGITPTILPLDG